MSQQHPAPGCASSAPIMGVVAAQRSATGAAVWRRSIQEARVAKIVHRSIGQ